MEGAIFIVMQETMQVYAALVAARRHEPSKHIRIA